MTALSRLVMALAGVAALAPALATGVGTALRARAAQQAELGAAIPNAIVGEELSQWAASFGAGRAALAFVGVVLIFAAALLTERAVRAAALALLGLGALARVYAAVAAGGDGVPLLTVLLAIPTFGALAILFLPRQWPNVIRRTSMTLMLVELAASFALLGGDYTTAGHQFAERMPWVEGLGISYHVAVDGISLWLVLLTTLLTPIAFFASWTGIQTKVKEYAIAFLLLETGMLGAFVALDLFLFYVFWELMLVPMYLIVGVWGGPDRVYAAVKFFLYTMVGSLLMLVAILYLVATYHGLAGSYTFDLAELSRVVLPFETQVWLFAAFALAFAIKVPMFPFHTWLPDAHVQAPTGGSVILAAVLLKLGTYGFLRFAMPLFPLASQVLAPSLAVLAVVGILYGALCAWVQRDVKKLVAYSSVSHLGFVMLGIFAMTESGVQGAILQMVNHGISTGALFILVGVIYERRHTRDLDQFGGLAKVMPIYTLLFVIVTMSSVGLPGTNGFIGEFMILVGTYASGGPVGFGDWSHSFALTAALGVIFAAVYMLHAVLKMFWGPVTREENASLPDVHWREGVALAPLIAMVFWLGLFPNSFLESMTPSVRGFIGDFRAKWEASRADDSVRLLPARARDAAPTGEATAIRFEVPGDAAGGAR